MQVQILDATTTTPEPGDLLLRGATATEVAIIRPLLALQGQHVTTGLAIATGFQIAEELMAAGVIRA